MVEQAFEINFECAMQSVKALSTGNYASVRQCEPDGYMKQQPIINRKAGFRLKCHLVNSERLKKTLYQKQVSSTHRHKFIKGLPTPPGHPQERRKKLLVTVGRKFFV